MKIKNLFKGDYVNTIMTKGVYCVLMFISNVVLTRYLGTAFKGDYTWLISMSSIVSVIAGLGIYQSIPYFRRQGNNGLSETYINIFVLQALLYSIITVFLAVFFQNSTLTVFLVLAIMDLLSKQVEMLLIIDASKVRNRVLVEGAVVSLALSILILILFPASMLTASIVLIVVKLYYTVRYLIQAHVRIHIFSVRFTDVWLRIRFGFASMLAFLLVTMNYRVDVLMLKAAHNVTAADLSFYSTGVSIAEIIWFIPDIFKEVLFSKTAKKNDYENVSAALRVSNLVLIILTVVMALAGKPVISLLFGKSFEPSYGVTVLLFCGIPAMSWFKITNTLFLAQGRRYVGLVILGISAAVNVVANSLLIPVIGIYGAAVASIMSYLVCGIVFLLIYAKSAHIALYKLFLPTKADFHLILRHKPDDTVKTEPTDL